MVPSSVAADLLCICTDHVIALATDGKLQHEYRKVRGRPKRLHISERAIEERLRDPRRRDQNLRNLERAVGRDVLLGRGALVSIARELKGIEDDKSYLERGHSSINDYCLRRFGMTPARREKIISASLGAETKPGDFPTFFHESFATVVEDPNAVLAKIQEFTETLVTQVRIGRETLVRIAQRLKQIQDNLLYDGQYASMDDYCLRRWGMTAARRQQIVGGYEYCKSLEVETKPGDFPLFFHESFVVAIEDRNAILAAIGDDIQPMQAIAELIHSRVTVLSQVADEMGATEDRMVNMSKPDQEELATAVIAEAERRNDRTEAAELASKAATEARRMLKGSAATFLSDGIYEIRDGFLGLVDTLAREGERLSAECKNDKAKARATKASRKSRRLLEEMGESSARSFLTNGVYRVEGGFFGLVDTISRESKRLAKEAIEKN